MPPPPIDSCDTPLWSCMRFQCVLSVACTVGTVTAIRNTLRPTLGSDFERLRVEHVGVRGIRGFDERRVGGDGDRLLDRADFERDVERDELCVAMRMPRRSKRLEALTLALMV